jgi:hypothetical protein
MKGSVIYSAVHKHLKFDAFSKDSLFIYYNSILHSDDEL